MQRFTRRVAKNAAGEKGAAAYGSNRSMVKVPPPTVAYDIMGKLARILASTPKKEIKLPQVRVQARRLRTVFPAARTGN